MGRPTHIRVLKPAFKDSPFTMGAVYRVLEWRGGGAPVIINNEGDPHTLSVTQWEPTPTHLRVTETCRPYHVVAGEVYEIVKWSGGGTPAIRTELGGLSWCGGFSWEPASPPFAPDVSNTDTTNSTLVSGETSYPDDNPKTALGYVKPSMRAVPPIALFRLGLVMAHGEAKYGRFNYRAKRITASTYYDAAMRHLAAWHDGEDTDPESGQPHLAHVMACCAIALDAAALDKMNDDRTPGPLPAFLATESAK